MRATRASGGGPASTKKGSSPAGREPSLTLANIERELRFASAARRSRPERAVAPQVRRRAGCETFSLEGLVPLELPHTLSRGPLTPRSI